MKVSSVSAKLFQSLVDSSKIIFCTKVVASENERLAATAIGVM